MVLGEKWNSWEAWKRSDAGKKRCEEDHGRGLARPYGLHAHSPEGAQAMGQDGGLMVLEKPKVD